MNVYGIRYMLNTDVVQILLLPCMLYHDIPLEMATNLPTNRAT